MSTTKEEDKLRAPEYMPRGPARIVDMAEATRRIAALENAIVTLNARVAELTIAVRAIEIK